MQFCNYCPGYCCYRIEGAVLRITAQDVRRLARHFGLSEHEFHQRYMESRHSFKVKEDGSCIFQAPDRLSRRCTIHRVRPRQCREFPFGRPCPYLERKDLLEALQGRIEDGLKNAWANASTTLL